MTNISVKYEKTKVIIILEMEEIVFFIIWVVKSQKVVLLCKNLDK
jgi:hypothetical protein